MSSGKEKHYFTSSFAIVGDKSPDFQSLNKISPIKKKLSPIQIQKKKMRQELDKWNSQLGMKSSWVTFQWQQQQSKCHKNALKTMTSFVAEDVKKHMRKIRDDAKLYNNETMKQASKNYHRSRLDKHNKDILKRLFLVSVTETPITKITSSTGRRREKKQRQDRLKAIRQAKQSKMDYINSENELMLRRIAAARSSFDHKKEKEFFARHKKLRAAMRKVKDKPKPKRKRRRKRLQKLEERTTPIPGIVPPLPALNAKEAEPDLVKMGNSNYQAMISLDGKRVQASAYVLHDKIHFDLIDPNTGAKRGFDLTTQELNNLIDTRFREMRGMSGRHRLKGLVERLPKLLQGY
jgi:hypothetical protein